MISRRSPYRRQRGGDGSPTVSLTPLIDTALTLLVVFMVAAPAIHRSVRVDLPKGSSAEEMPRDRASQDLTISIDKDGQIFIDGKQADRVATIAAVRAAARESRGALTVFMSIDRKVPSGTTLELFADVQAIEGVKCVGFDYSSSRS